MPAAEASTTPRRSLAVIVPALNEADGIAPLLARLVPVLEELNLDWSVVFVDDGSTDATWDVLRRAHASDARIKAVALSRNFGKEIALAAGLRYASADAVVILDSDLQHPPEAIPAFVAKWREGYDVVYGQRIDRSADSAWRRRGAKVFYRLFQALSGTSLQERAGDFRLLSRRAVEAINRIGERKRYNNGLFAWIGFPSIGVPFSMQPRADRNSRWSPVKLVRLALDGFTSFSTVPLRVSTLFGLSVSAIAFLYMLIILAKTAIYGDPVPGFPTLMVVMLFFSGIQLIFLGILGEYLGRVYEEVKARPLFLVRDELGVAAEPETLGLTAHQPSHAP